MVKLDILRNKGWLNSNHIDAIQKLTKARYPKSKALQSCLLVQNLQYKVQRENMVQILHCGEHEHWLTVSTIGCDKNEFDIFDSMSKNELTGDVIEQICAILCVEAGRKIQIGESFEYLSNLKRFRHSKDSTQIFPKSFKCFEYPANFTIFAKYSDIREIRIGESFEYLSHLQKIQTFKRFV